MPTVEGKKEFRCPFCFAWASSGTDEHGKPVAMHSLPACDTFRDIGVTEYLAAVKQNEAMRDA